jgi:hypothetical protein
VIAFTSLVPGTSYSIQVSGTDSAGSTVTQVVDFTTNQAPTGGKITVTPTSGIANDTKFKGKATGWSDPDSSEGLTYRWVYVLGGVETTVKASKPRNTRSFKLPAGSLVVKCYICDVNGTCTTSSVAVNVSDKTAE